MTEQKGKRFNTEGTEKRRRQIGNGNGYYRRGAEDAEKGERDPCLRQAGFARLEAMAPVSG